MNLSTDDLLEIREALERLLEDARYDEQRELRGDGIVPSYYARRVDHLVILRQRVQDERRRMIDGLKL